jgi:hypothetical protein
MIRREDGRPWFIHGVGFDITERKGLEETILEISAREQRRIAQDRGRNGRILGVSRRLAGTFRRRDSPRVRVVVFEPKGLVCLVNH